LNKYIRNYDFTYDFGPPWGSCSVTMTSVLGHTVDWDFPPAYRKWGSCDPRALFDCPTEKIIKVYLLFSLFFLLNSWQGGGGVVWSNW
jgi:DNA topoisomerase-3